MRNSLLFSLGIVVAATCLDARVADAQEYGGPRRYDCISYQHRDFAGSSMGLNAGRGYTFVGGRQNDQISSFRMRNGCKIIAFQHRDYKGQRTEFPRDVRYVGDLWNDQISSWQCSCRN